VKNIKHGPGVCSKVWFKSVHKGHVTYNEQLNSELNLTTLKTRHQSLRVCFKFKGLQVESSENNTPDGKKDFFSPLWTTKEGLLKLNYCWMGRESWHAIKKHYNMSFLTLKVMYPAIS